MAAATPGALVASEGKALPYQAELDKSMGDAIDAAVKESEQARGRPAR